MNVSTYQVTLPHPSGEGLGLRYTNGSVGSATGLSAFVLVRALTKCQIRRTNNARLSNCHASRCQAVSWVRPRSLGRSASFEAFTRSRWPIPAPSYAERRGLSLVAPAPTPMTGHQLSPGEMDLASASKTGLICTAVLRGAWIQLLGGRARGDLR
jgi:hypothetical protein